MSVKSNTDNKEALKKRVKTTYKKSKNSSGCDKSKKKTIGGFLFAKMAKGGAAELRSNADEVNRLNVFPVPDGDTGDNMRMTIESGIAAIENLNSDNLAEVMHVLSHGMLLGARGNSGVILSQFFAGVAAGFENAKAADVNALGAALKLGVKRAYSTVVTPTEGTILTVAREAVDFAVSRITPKTTVKSFFGDLVSEMYASLERTPNILPNLKEAGVVDSGGAGLFYIMDGFRRALNGEVGEGIKREKRPAESNTLTGINADICENAEFLYCTEMLIRMFPKRLNENNFDEDRLREQLCKIGDSVATVLADGIMKVHVHTGAPEQALELIHRFGEFLNVKIENITLQEIERKSKSNQLFTNEGMQSGKAAINAAIAVSSGEGISTFFRELGADLIIEYKNGSPPSTRDFIDAFEKTDAKNIFVLPNNSNILLAANQAARIYGKANVTVIDTKSIGMGYAALAAFDHENPDTGRQIRNVLREIESTLDGYVSPAARDAELDGIRIKKGDTIGILEKRVAVCKRSVFECAYELARMLLLNKSHLTVFYGADINDKEASKLMKKIKAKHPDVEICLFFGGQEIYPYIFLSR